MSYIGYGTWKIPSDDEGIQIIKNAVDAGYRHFDSAERYENEVMLGTALRYSGVKRENLWITGKVWKNHMGYDQTLFACEKTLERLGFDYLDCYLIHWPVPLLDNPEMAHKINLETWKAMERLKVEGMVHKIGVANFMERHLKPLLAKADYLPEVNQIEVHPGCPQTQTLSYCEKENIKVEAWSPLGSGAVLNIRQLWEIAEKHHSSTPELCLNWLLEQGISPIVRSSNKERMKKNLNIERYHLTDEEKKAIFQLPLQGDENGINPDTFVLV